MSDSALAGTINLCAGIVGLLGVIMTLWAPTTTRRKGIFLTLFLLSTTTWWGLSLAQSRRAAGSQAAAAEDQRRASAAQQRAELSQQSLVATQGELAAAQERGAAAQLRAAELLNELTRKGLRVAVSGQAVVSPELLEERKRNRSDVARLLTEGDAIKADSSSLQENPGLENRASKWASMAMKELGRIDPGYASMFHDPSGPTYSRTKGGKPIPTINENVWNWVNLRTEVLKAILEKMP